jgi:aminoglycoside 6'-N-acetyltransferase I
MKIREAQGRDRLRLAEMMVALWPDGDVGEYLGEVEKLIQTHISGTLPGTFFVATGKGGSLTGFIQVGLRSHADGCDTAAPVGFIEGWYVEQEFRSVGIGRKLMEAAEGWARGQGCREMASDALLGNEPSLRAHSAAGFEIVDRCVHFRKSL